MKQINEIKKELEDTDKDTKTKYNKLRKDLKKIKKLSDKYHKDLQIKAKESSGIFERLTEISKEISSIKKEKNLTKVILTGLKDQINTLNTKLSSVLTEMSKIPGAAKNALKFSKPKDEKIKLKLGNKLDKDAILKLQKKLMRK